MTLRYLLDTNIIPYTMPLRPVANVVQRMAELTDEVGTGAPVVHELLHGILRMPAGRRRQLVEEYFQTTVLQAMTILPYDQIAAEWHASGRGWWRSGERRRM
jgi:tRNA(fMet)-specific endonuclease VapC